MPLEIYRKSLCLLKLLSSISNQYFKCSSLLFKSCISVTDFNIKILQSELLHLKFWHFGRILKKRKRLKNLESLFLTSPFLSLYIAVAKNLSSCSAFRPWMCYSMQVSAKLLCDVLKQRVSLLGGCLANHFFHYVLFNSVHLTCILTASELSNQAFQWA